MGNDRTRWFHYWAQDSNSVDLQLHRQKTSTKLPWWDTSEYYHGEQINICDASIKWQHTGKRTNCSHFAFSSTSSTIRSGFPTADSLLALVVQSNGRSTHRNDWSQSQNYMAPTDRPRQDVTMSCIYGRVLCRLEFASMRGRTHASLSIVREIVNYAATKHYV